MTTQTATPSQAPAAKPPLRLFLTLLHLAGVGVLGGIIFSALTGLLSAGLGLLLVAGIGVVLLVGLVYALFAVGWFEVARVSGLYRTPIAPLRWRPRDRPGFSGWIRALGRQAIDGRMWRAIANFAISAVLGWIVLRLAWGLVWSIAICFAPLVGAGTVLGPFGGMGITAPWAPLVGILGIAACTFGMVGLAALHRVLSLSIVIRAKEAELTERVRTSTAQREGAVRAADVERTRIERDLHDGVQPRLVSVGMTLGLAQQKIDTDPDAAKELITEAHTSTKAAITELRQLARGIHASVLDDRGLDAALSALAGRSHIPVQLDVRMDGRCSREAEAAVYFSIAESLTNAAKHSRASEARVTVRLREGGVLWARVEDNGMGGAQVQPGGGLDGIANRILAAGGTFRLDSPAGGPTSLEVNVPCAS
ncbi:sensor histidine kinase [Microbacterium sp. LWO14-1.2]|jgi:signal transduction histidine kinase|uniref:sensor histidine kinase n=1 Tax=unclassified Microbacterium TaxID=2609290 RepID=UPI003139A112